GIATSTTFKEFFSKTCSYSRKPTIIIIDEASKMYDLTPTRLLTNSSRHCGILKMMALESVDNLLQFIGNPPKELLFDPKMLLILRILRSKISRYQIDTLRQSQIDRFISTGCTSHQTFHKIR